MLLGRSKLPDGYPSRLRDDRRAMADHGSVTVETDVRRARSPPNVAAMLQPWGASPQTMDIRTFWATAILLSSRQSDIVTPTPGSFHSDIGPCSGGDHSYTVPDLLLLSGLQDAEPRLSQLERATLSAGLSKPRHRPYGTACAVRAADGQRRGNRMESADRCRSRRSRTWSSKSERRDSNPRSSPWQAGGFVS